MQSPGSVLLIMPGALGDVINTIPAIKALRGKFHGAKIEAAGAREWMGLLQAGGLLERIHDLDMPGFHSLFHESGPPGDQIKEFLAGFDLIISWLRDRQGTIKAGLDQMGLKSIFFREKFPPDPGSLPASLILSQPVRELDIHRLPAWPELKLLEKPAAGMDGIPGGADGPLIGVNPGSGSITKCWPADWFAKAAETLAVTFSLQLVLIEGPADAEASSSFRKNISIEYAVLKNRPILDVAHVLTSAKFYFGNDSGISHLAASLGVPSLMIFGPTDPEVWGPRQPWARVIRADVDCAPCTDEKRRECSDRKCLGALSPQDVVGEASGIILESGV